MRARSGALRLMCFAVAAVLGWSMWSACADAASITPSEQMACCQDGHVACGEHGSPAQCCAASPQTNPSAPALRKTIDSPSLVFDQMIAPAPWILAAVWRSSPLTDSWSPPGSKHPTYLVLSTLRI